jgi:hypothetical protein
MKSSEVSFFSVLPVTQVHHQLTFVDDIEICPVILVPASHRLDVGPKSLFEDFRVGDVGNISRSLR